jgi:hypothetical protein
MGAAPSSAGPVVFVFDDRDIEQDQWTLKRIAFLYECLLELPVEIRRGESEQQLLAAMADHQCDSVVTADSPDPRIQRTIAALRRSTFVEVVPAEPFVELEEPIDLRRFARYWKKAEAKLFAKLR